MTREIYLAGGCFWGFERFFKLIEGVVATEVGYANGDPSLAEPSYQQVCTDTTGYAEAVHITYDPAVVGLEFLLDMYFLAIDPTSLNKQGEDEGTQYRTGIYYVEPDDLPLITSRVAREEAKYYKPLVVEVLPLRNFYRAEDYHQNYLEKNPDGYCHLPVALFELARTARQK